MVKLPLLSRVASLGMLLLCVPLRAVDDDCGDTPATAGVLVAAGANRSATVFPYRDVDLFRVELVAGQTVYFTATDTQSGVETDFSLALLGTDGTTELHAGTRVISYRVPVGAGGTHYLRVEAPISSSGSAYLGGYVVRATVGDEDDHANGPDAIPVADQLTEANVGTAVIGTIERNGDRDFFSFSLPANRAAARAFQVSAGSQYYVTSTSNYNMYDFSCRVFAGNAVLVADNPGTLVVPAGAEAVTYQIEVGLAGELSSGNLCRYPLFIREVPLASLELTSLAVTGSTTAAPGDEFEVAATVTNTALESLAWNTSVPLDLALSADAAWDGADAALARGSVAPGMTNSNYLWNNTTDFRTGVHIWNGPQSVTFPAAGNYRLVWWVTRQGVEDGDLAELRVDNVELKDGAGNQVWYEDFEHAGTWGSRGWTVNTGDVDSQLTDQYAYGSWSALCGKDLAIGQTSELTLLVSNVDDNATITFHYRSESVGYADVGMRVERVLAPGESLPLTMQAKVAEGTEAGTYYVLGQIPPIPTMPEADFTDNTLAAVIDNRLTVTAKAYPDLAVSNVVVTPHPTGAALAPGDSVEVSWTVANIGAADTQTGGAGWRETVSLTDDPQGKLGLQYAGEIWVEDFAAGASDTRTLSITVPDGISGTWYVVVGADASRWSTAVPEGPPGGPTRANNTAVAAESLQIPSGDLANLVITSISTDRRYYGLGDTMVVTYVIQNIGTAAVATGFQDRISLSTDQDRHASYPNDYGMNPASPADAGILPGDSVTRHATVILPSTVTAIGEHWLVIAVDVAQYSWDPTPVAEGQAGGGSLGGEGDNCELGTGDRVNGFGGGIWIVPPNRPDVAVEITGITPDPATSHWADAVTVSYRVTNIGTVATTAWQDEFYFSPDAAWSSGDTRVGSVVHPSALAPGAFVDSQFQFSLPMFEDDPATFHLLVIANRANLYFNEYTDTANNVATQEFTVASAPSPDLVVSEIQVIQPGIQAGQPYYWGQPVGVRYAVTNQGLAATTTSWNDLIRLYQGLQSVQYLGTYLGAPAPWEVRGGAGTTATWGQKSVALEEGKHVLVWKFLRDSNEGDSHLAYVDAIQVTDGDGTVYTEDFESAVGGALPAPAGVFASWTTSAGTAAGEHPWDTGGPGLGYGSASAARVGSGFVRGDWGVLRTVVTLNGPGKVTFRYRLDTVEPDDVLTFQVEDRLEPGETVWRRVDGTFAERLTGSYSVRVLTDSDWTVAEFSHEDNNEAALGITLQPPALPNLVPVGASFPDHLTRGSDVMITVTIRNQGAGVPTRGWGDRLGLMNDADQVTWLGVIAQNAGLASGATRTSTFGGTIPGNLPLGTYRVKVVVDYADAVPETGETDNALLVPAGAAAAGTVEIQSCDLEPVAFGSDDTAAPGGPLAVQWTIRNYGPGSSPVQWTDRIVYSDKATWAEAASDPQRRIDTLVRPYPVALGPSTEQAYSTDLRVPEDVDSDGDHQTYLYLVTDALDSTTETDETNNVLARTGPIRIGTHDLVVTDPDGTAELGTVVSPWITGTQHQISWTVQNAGDLTTRGGWSDIVYLSTNQDPEVSDEDIAIEEITGPGPLAPAESYTQTCSLRLPPWRAAWTTGTDFYLKVRANAGRSLVESAVANNFGTWRVHLAEAPAPDLQVPLVETPPTALASQQLYTVTYTITNAGPVDATGSWHDSISLIDDDEEPVARAFLAHPEKVWSWENNTGGIWRQATVSVPAGIHRLAWVFHRPASESFANNRALLDDIVLPLAGGTETVAFSEAALPPGFASDATGWAVTDSTGHDALGAAFTQELPVGASRVLTFTGDFAAGHVTFWYQTDGHELTFYRDYAIPAGATVTFQQEIELPVAFSGSAAFRVYADSGDTIPEPGREGNNHGNSGTFQVGLAPYPDLACTAVDRLLPADPAEVRSGELVEVRWTVANQDPPAAVGAEASPMGEATGWYDEVYLSADSTLDPAEDERVGVVWHRLPLARGATYTASLAFILPDGGASSWHVFVRVDVAGSVFENGEKANNVSAPLVLAAAAGVYPDLRPFAVLQPEEIPAGGRFTAYWRVENAGEGAADGRWAEKLYLSTDSVLDDADQLLATVNHAGLHFPFTTDPANPAFYVEQAEVQLPDQLTGFFYLLVDVDADGALFEANALGSGETNNTVASPRFQVVVPETPNLTVPRVRVQSLTRRGNQLQLQVEWTVRNTGSVGTGAAAWWEQLRFSTTPDLYGELHDLTKVGNQSFLEPGESYTQTATVTVPWAFPEGDYYLVVQVDSQEQVHEFQAEEDNLGVSQDAEGNQVTVAIPLLPEPRPYVAILSSFNDPTQTAPDSPADDITVLTPVIATGQHLRASWTAKNIGDAPMTGSNWDDGCALSTDPFYDPSDLWLGSHNYHNISLAPGQSDRLVNMVVSNPIPIDLPTGEYYLLIVADTHRFGSPWAGNVGVASTKVRVVQAPTADLLVVPESIVCATAAPNRISGRSFSFHWRVENGGLWQTDASSWEDEVWISRDPYLDDGDTLVGKKLHEGILQPAPNTPDPTVQWFYEASLAGRVPPWLAGDYYVIVFTAEKVYEGGSRASKSNNLVHSVAPITILPGPTPDLVPSNLRILTPAAARRAGSTIEIEWTTTNRGTAATDTQAAAWPVQFYLQDAASESVVNPVGWLLSQGEPLAAGERRTNHAELALPPDTPSRIRLVIWEDHIETGLLNLKPFGDIYERDADDNNTWTAPAVDILPLPVPDLEITAHGIAAPGVPIASGSRIEFSYTVTNTGDATPKPAQPWTDRIFLSADALLDPDDTCVATFKRKTGLGAGLSYTVEKSIATDPDLLGDWFLFVVADADGELPERSEDTNASSPPDVVSIVLGAAPDLHIASVDLAAAEPSLAPVDGNPAVVLSGQQITGIAYTVENLGDAAPDSPWVDAAWLSRDRYLDAADLRVGYVQNQVRPTLDPGTERARTMSIKIPPGISGDWYLLLETDASANLHERAGERNNVFLPERGAFFTVQLPPATGYDLTVADVVVSAPLVLAPGLPFHLQWGITNASANTIARSRWTDAVYLSQDDQWDTGDTYVGAANPIGSTSLAAGETVTRAANFIVPAMPEGEWYVLVRANVHRDIIESDGTNNVGACAAANRLDLAVPQLHIETDPGDTDHDGISDTDTATAAMAVGGDYYYRVDVEPGEDLEVTLSCADRAAVTELFVRYGEMATPVTADYIFPNLLQPDQRIVVPGTHAGSYYILARGISLPNGGDYTLTVRYLRFEVTALRPLAAGNAGISTFTISGARFRPDSTAVLVAPDRSELAACQLHFESSTRIHAAFDLTGGALGDYTLRVTNPAEPAARTTTAVAEFATPVEVSTGSGGRLGIRVVAPSTVRLGASAYCAQILYENTGDADIPAPLLHFRADGPQGVEVRLTPADEWTTGFIELLGVNEDGPADRLPPGASFSAQVMFRARNVGMWYLNVRSLELEDSLQDWDAMQESVLGEDRTPDSDEQRMLAYLKAHYGLTYPAFAAGLRADALRLWRQGRPTGDVRRLLAFAVSRGYERPVSAVVGFLRDIDSGTFRNGTPMALRSGNGHLYATTTDRYGRFSFQGVAAGEYQLSARGLALDSLPHLTITGDVDATGFFADGHAIPGGDVPEVGPDDKSDADATLARAPGGELHMVWARGDQIWHAVWDGSTTAWNATALGDGVVEGAPVPGAVGRAPRLLPYPAADLAAPIPAERDGVLLLWQAGFGADNGLNGLHYMMALGCPVRDGLGVPTGRWQWTAPTPFTQGQIGDTQLTALVAADSLLGVFLQRNWAIENDDTDLYWQTLVPPAPQYARAGCETLEHLRLALDPVLESRVEDSETHTLAVTIKMGSGTSIPSYIPLIGGRYGYKIEGSIEGKLSDCEFSITGKLGGTAANDRADAVPQYDVWREGTRAPGIRLDVGKNISFEGSAGLAAAWRPVCKEGSPCDWGFDGAKLNLSAGGAGKIPGLNLSFFIASVVVGAKVTAAAGLELEWSGDNFPALPDEAAGDFTVGFGPFGKAEFAGGFVEAEVGGSGFAKIAFEPAPTLDGYGIKLEAKAGAGPFSYSFEKEWKWGGSRGDFERGIFLRETVDHDTLRFVRGGFRDGSGAREVLTVRLAPYIGSGANYSDDGGAALESLSALADNRRMDTQPVLAANAAGTETLVAWIHDADDTTRRLGASVRLAAWSGPRGSWTPLPDIASAADFNRAPTLLFDANDEPWVFWSSASAATVTPNDDAAAIYDAMQDADIRFAHRVAGVWTTPETLVSLAGADESPTAILLPNGDLGVAWINRALDGGAESMVALRYDAATSQWDAAPVTLSAARGRDASTPLLAQVSAGVTAAGEPIVSWIQTVNPDSETPNHILMWVRLAGAAWTAPAWFHKPAAATREDAAVRTDRSGISPPIAPSDECCEKCEKCETDPTASDCKKDKPKLDPPDPDPLGEPSGAPVKAITSHDPNAKHGPEGVGDTHAVAADAVMNYTILFENKDTAEAPASVVTVTDQLEASLDLTRFRLGEIAFGDTLVQVPSNRSFHFETLRLANGMDLVIVASLDPQSRTATWEFRTIDPATGALPSNPGLGFLPPNDASSRGEGHVTFTILPVAGIADGTVITNQATIVFDDNEAIVTNVAENTIATSAYASAVLDFSGDPGDGEDTVDSDLLPVSWALDGASPSLDLNETGSGFDVFYAVNGGPYTLWQNSTSSTTATLAVSRGSTYRFYSVAHDGAGNRELPPGGADATVRILHGDVTFGGSLAYAGRRPGELMVELFGQPKDRGTRDSFAGAPTASVSPASPGSYAFAPVPGEGTIYALRAFLDADGDGSPSADEPQVSVMDLDPVGRAALITVPLVLTDPDTDHDTLPDWWEMYWFHDLAQTAWDDPDRDGSPNGAEYRNNTDPTDGTDATLKPVSTAAIQTRNGFLYVDGAEYTIRGVSYLPAAPGETPSAASYTTERLQRDLPHIAAMGANTVRIGVRLANSAPLDACVARGLRVILDYPISPAANLADPTVQAAIRTDFTAFVEQVKDHPALLMWCIGDSVNANQADASHQQAWYDLLNALAWIAYAAEGPAYHPVTTANAGTADLATYAGVATAIDLWGIAYAGQDTFGAIRGSALTAEYASLGLGVPMWVASYGVDAWDEAHGRGNDVQQGRVAESLARTLEQESATATFQAARDVLVAVGTGQEVADGDAGMQSGLAFQDANANGRWDAGEDVWFDAVVSRSGCFEAAGDTAILGTPADGDVGIQAAIAFHDANTNGSWDAGEDIWQDRTADGARARFYDAGVDPILYDGGAVEVSDGQAGLQGGLYYRDRDGNGAYTNGEPIWQDRQVGLARVFDAARDSLVYTGATQEVADSDLGLAAGLYFRDADGNRRWSAEEDVWSKAPGGAVGGVVREYSDQWSAVAPAGQHDLGGPGPVAGDAEYFGLFRYREATGNSLAPRLAYYTLQSVWTGIPGDTPIVEETTIETPEGTPVTFPVRLLHADGWDISLILPNGGLHGRISNWNTRAGLDAVTYTPDPHFTGADRIDYRLVSRTLRDEYIGSIIVTVTPVDGAPSDLGTEPDTSVVAAPENQELLLTVVARETDGQAVSFTYALPDGESLTGAVLSPATYDGAADLWSATLAWTPGFDESSRLQNREVAVTFTATDSTGHAAELTRTIEVINVNRPPVAVAPTLAPVPQVFATEPLIVSWGYTDPDGDAEVPPSAQIRWFRASREADAGTLLPALSNLASVPAGSLVPGDNLFCRVWPSDGDLPATVAADQLPAGSAVASAQVAVLNAPRAVHITPADAMTGQDITPDLTWSSDTAPPLDYDLAWHRNGQPAGTGTSISGQDTVRGQQWTVTVVAWVENGRARREAPAVVSPVLTIHDTPPPAPTAAVIAPESPAEQDDVELVDIVQASDADGDAIDHEVQWSLQADFAAPVAGNPLPSDLTSYDDLWWVRVRSTAPDGSGGTAHSAWFVVGSVPISCRYDLLLYPGWNLVSLPIQPIDLPATVVDESTAVGLFGDLKRGEAWYWQNDGQTPACYVAVDPVDQEDFTGTLEALRGFWVYRPAAVGVEAPIVVPVPGRPLDSGATPDSCIRPLHAQWNLWGPCADFRAVPPTVPGLLSPIQTWQCGPIYRYLSLDYDHPDPDQRVLFLRGRAYWLNIGADALPTSINLKP